ncbi:hypothetical protein IX321_002674 [Bacteroides pyogenes]|nr:hypothetical protein [Bacteroides pyogenes]MBR8716962.1 hypothetical protein [Bacteroides pyogenes]MBR8748326.1 hypothetical protein [Bacteroides pyogenes]MBR8758495.1 hypothetical protein [Bacteroides pyogenes]MBR8781731.1 hypothetical protein [Bacteroides pyogenes]
MPAEQGKEGLPSCLIVVKESLNGINTFLVEVGNGFVDIAHRIQNDGGRNGFFSFHREMGKEVHKALEDAERSVARFFCNHGYILWGDCSLECLVVPKFIPSCTIGKADGRVFTSSYFVTNMTEIRACHGRVYLTYLSKIVLQILGQFFADEENAPYITWSLFTSYLFHMGFTMKGSGCKDLYFSFGKMRHCFVGTASTHPHHKVDDASTLACPIVVPQVLPKVYFQAGVGVFSVGCVIKGIAVVTLGRLDTASVQIVRYRYCLDML